MQHSATAVARVDSLNVSGGLRDVPFAGQLVRTGFFKSPVQGSVQAHRLGLAGDAQGDLSVHGGPQKAVYFYPKEHYAAWQELLDSEPLASGSFGENITSEGLLETDLSVGDVIQVGGAILQVLQPRSPCYKLQIRFERPDMTALFFRHGKPGWYTSVLREGAISTGDEVAVIERASNSLTIAQVWHLSTLGELNQDTLKHVLGLRLLPDFWKERILRRL